MEKGYGWRDGPAVRDGALVLGEDMVLAESDFCSEPLVCLDRKINRKGKRWLDWQKCNFYSDICSWWCLHSFKAETKSTTNYNNHHSNDKKKSPLGLFPNPYFGIDCLLLAPCVLALLGSDKKHTSSCTLKCARNRKRDTVLQKETDWLQAFSRSDFVVQHQEAWCTIANQGQIFCSLWRAVGQYFSQNWNITALTKFVGVKASVR